MDLSACSSLGHYEISERLVHFQREAKTLAASDHPGIVTVFSVEVVGRGRE